MRDAISVVPQDIPLFNDSIRFNIEYGRINASMEDIISAAKRANIYNSIQRMPEKFETRVGERGLMLSGMFEIVLTRISNSWCADHFALHQVANASELHSHARS